MWGRNKSGGLVAALEGLVASGLGLNGNSNSGPVREVGLAAINLFVGRWLFLESRQRFHRVLLSCMLVATMLLAAPLGLALHWAALIVQHSLSGK